MTDFTKDRMDRIVRAAERQRRAWEKRPRLKITTTRVSAAEVEAMRAEMKARYPAIAAYWRKKRRYK